MATTHVGSICATIVVAAAAWNVAVQPAQAQFSLWPQFRPWRVYHAPVRHKHHHRDTNSRLTKKAPAQDAEKGPLHIVVSIADQRISVYDDGALIARSSVSTGVPDHPTPSGIFSVISKQRWHRSNLYSDAPMPYMQRITWSGIALHAGVLPGYPASHGCIRLKSGFCHSTVASHKARHPCDHRAQRCPTGRDRQSSPPASGVRPVEDRSCHFGQRDDRGRRGALTVNVRDRFATATGYCPSSRFGTKDRPDLRSCEP